MDPREAALRPHQRRQHGLFTLRQALDAGFGRAAVRRRLQTGRWIDADTRVYRVTDGVALDARRRVMARTLATGGVASGMTAGACWGFVEFPRQIHVTVPRAQRQTGVAGLHSSRALETVDTTTLDGIPVTTPTRTLIDLAAVLPRDRIERVLDAALVAGVARIDRLETRARALNHPRRPGCAAILRLLGARHPDMLAARSALEAHALRACARAGLPLPDVNYEVVTGGRVRYLDLAWPEERVAVELDGFVPHSTRAVFDDDRVRQNDLVVDGWTVLRLTATALHADPACAFAPVIAVLEGRRAVELVVVRAQSTPVGSEGSETTTPTTEDRS